MVLDGNVALTDKQYNGTENYQQCGTRTSASFHFWGSISFVSFCNRMAGRSLQPSHVTVWLQCKMDHGDAPEQTSLPEKTGKYIERRRISLILFTAKTGLSSSSNSSVNTTTGNKNLWLGNDKKLDKNIAGRKK